MVLVDNVARRFMFTHLSVWIMDGCRGDCVHNDIAVVVQRGGVSWRHVVDQFVRRHTSCRFPARLLGPSHRRMLRMRIREDKSRETEPRVCGVEM